MLSRFSLRSCTAATVLAALATVGCDKVPLGAPTESSISVSAAAQTLPPGGATEVTAFVVEQSGTPVHDGTLVRFTATLGQVSPAEVETRRGFAVTTFTAGSSSGTATVRAVSGAASGITNGTDAATSSNLVQIQIGGAAVESVAVTASPTRVGSGGGTVSVTAWALDAAGNRLAGVPVTFSTTQGTLSASSATTDASGDATVSLTTSRDAKVTATANAKSGSVDISVAPIATISLSTTPASPVAGQAVTLTVTPSIPSGGQAPRVVVSWGDGTQSDMGTVSAARSTTHVYSASGTYTISATGTADGESSTAMTTITVSAPTTATVALSFTPASPTARQTVTLTVTPTIASGGQAPRVVVNWGDGSTTDLGTVASARSTTHVYSSAGTYAVTATATAEGTSTATTTITVSAAAPISVTVAGPSTTTKCSALTFTATVTPTGTEVSSYAWTIDGTDREDETVTTTGNTLTRVFRDTGIKTISVVATTSDGRTGNGQTQVNVTEPTPPTTCG